MIKITDYIKDADLHLADVNHLNDLNVMLCERYFRKAVDWYVDSCPYGYVWYVKI